MYVPVPIPFHTVITHLQSCMCTNTFYGHEPKNATTPTHNAYMHIYVHMHVHTHAGLQYEHTCMINTPCAHLLYQNIHTHTPMDY